MPDPLSRRVGPFPLWGWIVAGLVAYFVWIKSNRPGFFPVTSGEFAEPGGVGVSLGARLGFGDGGGEVPPEEPASGLSFLSSGSASVFGERDMQPAPVTSGGGGGNVGSFSSSSSSDGGGGGIERTGGIGGTRFGGGSSGTGGGGGGIGTRF